MKKNELVHVHALLSCVAEDLLERGAVDREAFDDYRAHGVSPRSLRAPRTDHETAVRLLADCLSSALDDSTADERSDASMGRGASDASDRGRDADASESEHARSSH